MRDKAEVGRRKAERGTRTRRGSWLPFLLPPAAFLLVGDAAAQPAFPSKPVRLIVGNPPGGASDVIARIIGPPLGARLGQNVVIDNRPGANGNISAEIPIPLSWTLIR